jgi:hypothetical protein
VPTILDELTPPENQRYLEDLIRRGALPLPSEGNYRLGGIYWRHIAKYGAFRPDRLFEEQDEHLASGE